MPGEGAVAGQLLRMVGQSQSVGLRSQYSPIVMPALHARQEAIIARQQSCVDAVAVAVRRPSTIMCGLLIEKWPAVVYGVVVFPLGGGRCSDGKCSQRRPRLHGTREGVQTRV